jgi:carboxypeptidase T
VEANNKDNSDMRHRIILIGLCFCLLSISSVEQTIKAHQLVEVAVPSSTELQQIVRLGLDIWEVKDGKAMVYIWSAEELAQLEARGISYRIIQPDRRSIYQWLNIPLALPSDAGLFHTYDEVLTELDNLEASYPDIAASVTIGTTYEGRSIAGLKISDNVTYDDPDEPIILIFGCQHAREWISVEVSLGVAKYLAEHYTTDTTIQYIVDSSETYIFPMINPDGHSYCVSTDRLWRKNRKPNDDGITVGVDINRNFSYNWEIGGSGTSPGSSTYRGPYPFSEQETLAIKNFVELHPRVVAVINYHSWGQDILYAWAYTHTDAPNRMFLDGLAAPVEAAIEAIHGSDYVRGQWADILAYTGGGTTADWCNADIGVPCLTIELPPNTDPPGFVPPESAIEPAIQENVPGALWLMQWAINEWNNGGGVTVSNVQLSAITDTSVRISWDADRASWGQIEYGTDAQYGSVTQIDKIPNLSHSMLVDGLLSGTTYHYCIVATDLGRRITRSADGMFTTTGTPSRIDDWKQFEERANGAGSSASRLKTP